MRATFHIKFSDRGKNGLSVSLSVCIMQDLTEKALVPKLDSYNLVVTATSWESKVGRKLLTRSDMLFVGRIQTQTTITYISTLIGPSDSLTLKTLT